MTDWKCLDCTMVLTQEEMDEGKADEHLDNTDHAGFERQ